MIYTYELRDKETRKVVCVFEARSFGERCYMLDFLDPAPARFVAVRVQGKPS